MESQNAWLRLMYAIPYFIPASKIPFLSIPLIVMVILVLLLRIICFKQRQIAIVDFISRDAEFAFPMFFGGDIFRLDVAARESISQFTFWLDAVLNEGGLLLAFVC